MDKNHNKIYFNNCLLLKQTMMTECIEFTWRNTGAFNSEYIRWDWVKLQNDIHEVKGEHRRES